MKEAHPTWQWTPPPINTTRPPFVRATGQSLQMPTPWLAGVCSGLSVHLGISVVLVRWIVVITSLFGAGLLGYFLIGVLIPKDGDHVSLTNTDRLASGLEQVPAGNKKVAARNQLFMVGAACLLFSFLLILTLQSSALEFYWLIGPVPIFAGIGMVWSQSNNLRNWRTLRFWLMVIVGIILVIIGVTILVAGGQPTLDLLKGGLYGAGIVIVIVLTLIPLWVRTSAELSNAQKRQVRDAERADIAAHLHDSVLQTLTLIRSHANNPQQVRALALGQERELRAWLYTGKNEAATSTAQALREQVEGTEATYGVAVDVVCVGDVEPGPAELALVAAAGEAVTNAVRHGTPPVSVYLEVGRDQVEVFIKDRGVGFTLEAIPADRHGVRGSIIGRIERAGGAAVIRALDPGTEIHLSVPKTTNLQVG